MKNIGDYKAFLAKVSEETGISAFKPSADGLASMRVDDAYNVNLQFVEATGKVLCFVEVVELPHDAPREVYRDLLVGGLFGKDTAGGYFSLEPETETVVYNYLFDLDAAAKDVDDFISTIEKILQLCDIWAERIRGNMAAGGNHAVGGVDAVPRGHTIFHA